MCGICGIASPRGAVDPDRLAAMSGDARPPRARLRRHCSSTARSGSRRGGSRSSTSTRGDQPLANEDGTSTSSRTARSTTTRELRDELERAGHRFGRTATPRCSSTRYEEWGLAFARAAARHVRGRALGRARGAGSCSRATASGSSRSTTARRRRARVRVRAAALPRGEIDLDALEAFLAFNSIPAPLTIFRETRKLPPGHLLVWEGGEPRLERFARPGPLPRAARRRRGRARRGAARAAARLGARAPRRRRPGRRPALRRRRLGRCSPRSPRRSRRSRCGRSRSASRRRRSTSSTARARSRSATARPPRARAAAGRRAAAAGARRGLRRAVRRLVGAADLPRLAARRRGRQGRALRRGRRRALRRLLHLRRPTCSRGASARSRGSPARSSSCCRARRAGRASTTRRSASPAARTCRRSSATTPGRRSSRPTRAPS